MTQNKIKTCGWPGCDKEVFAEKALLCGQHDREGRGLMEQAGKLAAGAVAGIFTVVKLTKKLKN